MASIKRIGKKINESINEIIIIYYILINTIIFILSEEIDNSYILIKINDIGIQYIINPDFSPLPDEIYINEIKMENISYFYNLEDEGNIIKLKWNAKLNSCDNMFSGMKNITEIDISNFDTSEVTSMYSFFNECSKLKRINFKKDNNIIDTSLVTNMENMFYGCKSLIV